MSFLIQNCIIGSIFVIFDTKSYRVKISCPRLFNQVFLNCIFSEALGSVVVYMTKQYIMHENSNRLKQATFKNRPRQSHVSPWVTVPAYNHTRLTPSELLMEFFIFPRRLMNFERFQILLDKAIIKVGRF